VSRHPPGTDTRATEGPSLTHNRTPDRRIPTTTRRERELAATLRAIWEAASGAAEAVTRGHASYINLADSLYAIADDATEALAELPTCFNINANDA
jgi:hypothetical protein